MSRFICVFKPHWEKKEKIKWNIIKLNEWMKWNEIKENEIGPRTIHISLGYRAKIEIEN